MPLADIYCNIRMNYANTINQQILGIIKSVALFLFLTLGIFVFTNQCLAIATTTPEVININLENIVWSTNQPSNLIPVPEVTNIGQNNIINEFKPEIKGKVLNFHKVEIYLDHKFIGNARVKEGFNGWAEFSFQFDKNIDLGKHVIYTIAENIDKIRSLKSDPITFSVVHPFPTPTLYQPKNGQNQLKGVAWNNSILRVYLDEKLENQIELGEHISGVVGFSYTIIKPLQPGYHVVWVVAEDRISHKISKKSNQVIIYTPGSKLANIKPQISSSKTSVPSPTILTPQYNQVIDNPKPHISGLVKNDYLVKVFIDDQEDSNLVPIIHESGTTNFSQSINQELNPGLHLVHTQAIGLRGNLSGKSNVIKFIVAPELYHQKTIKTTPNIPSIVKQEEFKDEKPEITENVKKPKIGEGISVVELPKDGEIAIIEQTINATENQVGVIDKKIQTGEIRVEDKDVGEGLAPAHKTDEQEGVTPSESEPKKEDWINIGFIIVGIILVILIIWWVILERKEMKEGENKSSSPEVPKQSSDKDINQKSEDQENKK